MAANITVKNVMTKEVVSVYPETTVLEAHEIIARHRFNGVPVVDQDNHIVGILTEHNLVAGGSGAYLPMVKKLFAELPVYKKDFKEFKSEMYELSRLRVREIMNPDPLTISEDEPLKAIVDTFQAHHSVNPIPIVDKDNKVVGIVSRSDVVKFFYVIKLTQI